MNDYSIQNTPLKYVNGRKTAEQIMEQSGFLSQFSFDIRPYAHVREYDKDESIIVSTSNLTRILYLIKGTAKLYSQHKNGRQSLINFFTPPSFLGVPELFEESKQPYPLVAQTRCRFIEVDTTRCRTRLLQDALFLRFCCSMALKQNAAQNLRYMNLTAYPCRNNFAASLLLLQNDGILSVKYVELAEYLAVSYRHLMHLISELCSEGIVERVPRGLRILNWEEVYGLANEIQEHR